MLMMVCPRAVPGQAIIVSTTSDVVRVMCKISDGDLLCSQHTVDDMIPKALCAIMMSAIAHMEHEHEQSVVLLQDTHWDTKRVQLAHRSQQQL